MTGAVLILCLIVFEQTSARIILECQNHSGSDFKTNLIKEESQLYTGGSLKLNDEEHKVNNILMKYKLQEINEGIQNSQYFNFSKHYFAYKHDIEKSPVYKIIRKMPKGAALHIHDIAMLRSDDLVKLTYEDHLYACLPGDKLDLQFSETVPVQLCPVKWLLLSDLRNATDNIQQFDAELGKFFTLYTDDEKFLNANINEVWQTFHSVFGTIRSLINYRPVREKYFYMALKRFYEDNVMYVELRTAMLGLYELDGTKHDGIHLAQLYKRVTDNFIRKHPDFVGIKLIMASGRFADLEIKRDALTYARKVKKEIPEIFAGFDLVGQEDLGKPLSEYKPILLEAKDFLDYYFHAGETNWHGTKADENLFDAIELGSKRIGHGYSLIKHPSLIAHMIKHDIPLEVNVISNVVLKLVNDVRNHPLATYMAMGVPIVLSSDDPGAWDSDPMSHDFYVTFLGVASAKADIRLLKELALNSIKYSALDEIRKQICYNLFNRRWNVFMAEVIKDFPTYFFDSTF